MISKQFIYLILVLLFFPSMLKSCSGQHQESSIMANKYFYHEQPFPGNLPRIFSPGIISTELHDDMAPIFVSSEYSNEVYFRIAGKPKSLIFKMVLTTGGWSSPFLDTMAFKYGIQNQAFSIDGGKRYFSTNIASDGSEVGDYDIFYSVNTDGKWSLPTNLSNVVNTEYDEHIFHVLSDGSIFFGAEYPDGKGKMDIYFSKCINGYYLKPTNLSSINSRFVETAVTVDPEEKFMVFTSTRFPATSGINLWISIKDSLNEWSKPINMGRLINDIYTDKFARFSPDGEYLFWVSHRDSKNANPIKNWIIDDIEFPKVTFKGADIYWISTMSLERIINDE